MDQQRSQRSGCPNERKWFEGDPKTYGRDHQNVEQRHDGKDRVGWPEAVPLAQRNEQSHEGQDEPTDRGQPVEAVGCFGVRFVEKEKIAQSVKAELAVAAGVLTNEPHSLAAE